MKKYKVTYICIKEHINYFGKDIPVGRIISGDCYLYKENIDAFISTNWAINTFEEIIDKSPVVAKPPVVPAKNIRYLNRKEDVAT